MEECDWAQQTIVAPLSAIDDIFLNDRIPDAINLDSVEFLGKEALDGIKATMSVKKIDHWRQPRNAPAGCVSLVDWELYERINPMAKDHTRSKFRGMQEEIKRERAHDAGVQAVRDRIAAQGTAVDRINSGR